MSSLAILATSVALVIDNLALASLRVSVVQDLFVVLPKPVYWYPLALLRFMALFASYETTINSSTRCHKGPQISKKTFQLLRVSFL